MSDRYKNLGNGIIRDTITGLEWQADYVNRMPWQGAMDYAAGLDLGGHIDWRVPTIEESITLIDYSRVHPASAFPGMPLEWFWTSSPFVAAPYVSPENDTILNPVEEARSIAWSVAFDYGFSDYSGKMLPCDVRCVRGKRADLETVVKRLWAALRPFAHSDLCRLLAGNISELEFLRMESTVFQRGRAVLTLGDFIEARDALGEMEER